MSPRPPEKRPQDCWDWLTADDVVRHALAAFYAVCRDAQRPENTPFLANGQPAMDRHTLFEDLCEDFRTRLGAQAHWSGVPWCADHARYLQVRALARRPGCPRIPQAEGPVTPSRPSAQGVGAGEPVGSVVNTHPLSQLIVDNPLGGA